MRLTLRTMLAYMDEVDLQPEDHQDIGRKIEESEFASNLMHRIRDVTRRMRLAAPKVSGRGMGLDPNTVAEYIDNELAGERVPDFEKICLESDVHLAEVACCHQILSIMLREAADVDPDMRTRMYSITDRADPRARRGSVEPPPLTTVDESVRETNGREPVHARPRPEVPEYLRSQSRSRFWPVAIVAGLALCLLAAIILAAGPLDGTNSVLKLFGFGGDETAQSHGDKQPGAKTDPAQPATSTTGTNDKPSDRVVEPAAGTVRAATPNDTKNSTAPEKAGADAIAKPAAPAVGKGAADAPLTQPSVERPAVVAPAASDDRQSPIPPKPPADSGNPATNVPTSPEVNPNPARPTGVSPEKPLVPIVPPDVGPVVPPAAVPDLGDQRIGRLVSDKDVLLRMAAGKTEWHRVAPGVAFSTGDKLLVLPTFRPTVTLAAGVSLSLVPETLIEFEGLDQGVPIVRLHYGRMVLMTTGKANVKIKLAMGAAAGTVAFDDADATVAAEVRPFHLPGVNPETNEPRQAITLYGVSGEVSWIPSRGEPQKIQAPGQMLIALGPTPPTADREPPKWVGAEPVSPIDGRAAVALNESLDEQRAVTQSLLELAGHRREENRSLAARSLALIDEFEPLVNLLNDKDERSVWPIQIESLQAALARGPAVAAKVRGAFEKQRGKDGTELYRMLWGYSKDDLAAGAATRLVEYLDNDNVDFRVLSFHNLRLITGATFNYRPEQSAASRQQPVRRWRDQLKDGQLGPKSAPPAKLPAGEPAPTKTVPPPPTPDGP